MSRENMNIMRPQLKLEIDRLSPTFGDVLIVHPRESYDRFTEEYLDWIRDNIVKITPPGVRAMIMPDRSVKFDVLTPGDAHDDPELQSAYVEGWMDAFKALESKYCGDEEGQGDSGG